MADFFYPTLDQLIRARVSTLEADKTGLAQLLAQTMPAAQRGFLAGREEMVRERIITPRNLREQLIREGYVPHKREGDLEVPLKSEEFQNWYMTGEGDYILKKPVPEVQRPAKPKELVVMVDEKSGQARWVDPVTGQQMTGTTIPPMEGYAVKIVRYGEGEGGWGGGGASRPRLKHIVEIEREIKQTQFKKELDAEITPRKDLNEYMKFKNAVANSLRVMTPDVDIVGETRKKYIEEVAKENALVEELNRFRDLVRKEALDRESPYYKLANDEEALRKAFWRVVEKKRMPLPVSAQEIINAYKFKGK